VAGGDSIAKEIAMKSLLWAVAALAAANATAADFDVFKCTTQRGEVTYQPMACPALSVQQRIDVQPFSAGYDPSEGGKIFQREAEMDQRRAQVAKQEETAPSEAVVPEDPKIIGRAHDPALPTETSNDVKHQPFVSNAPIRRR
jgi:hypothetical protein